MPSSKVTVDAATLEGIIGGLHPLNDTNFQVPGGGEGVVLHFCVGPR